MNLDGVLFLSLGQNSNHDSGELGIGGQEVEATDGAGGDFDAPTRWQVTRSSWHGVISRDCRRRRWHDETAATRRKSHVRDRHQPGLCRRAAPGVLVARCGRLPTSPYEGRKNGLSSAATNVCQRGWPISVTVHRSAPTSQIPQSGSDPTTADAHEPPPCGVTRCRDRIIYLRGCEGVA